MGGIAVRFESGRPFFSCPMLFCGSGLSTRQMGDPDEPIGQEREQNLVRAKSLNLLGST
jgi:hypothetical protein